MRIDSKTILMVGLVAALVDAINELIKLTESFDKNDALGWCMTIMIVIMGGLWFFMEKEK